MTTTPTDPSPNSSAPLLPACYLVQHAIAKAANVGTLARVATAFGAAGVLVVAPSPKLTTFGAHGADAHVAFTHFTSLVDAKAWLTARDVDLVGVEIDDAAVPVTDPARAFGGSGGGGGGGGGGQRAALGGGGRRPRGGEGGQPAALGGGGRGPRGCAFLLGNEGTGLPPASIALCDRLAYIPQHGPGTASLNVACAAAVVLHAFTSWAGYDERARAGGKFCVAPRPRRTTARGVAAGPDAQDPGAVAAARAARKAAAAAAAAAAADFCWDGEEEEGDGAQGLGGVFGEGSE